MTVHETPVVSVPSGQTLLATELIIHHRCSGMFTRIYDWRSEEQPSQPLVAADLFFSCPLSYKDVGFFFARSEDVSTTILPRPPPLPKTFPRWRSSPIRDGCGVMDHRASGPCGELHPFNTNNNNVWTTNSRCQKSHNATNQHGA